MKQILAATFCLLTILVGCVAQDITALQQIGDVVAVARTSSGITLRCSDNSHVQLSVLAPDLIRVRAAFTTPVPERDHSWALAKTNWPATSWNYTETSEGILLTTSEVEVLVRRAPLLIEFRDAKTKQPINTDERPMVYDARGVLRELLFDPAAGSFVATAKRLGFDEHFYGLGEKAARLDKRRSSFVNWNSDTPGYVEGRDPIYQTIPFYLGVQRGIAYGIFFDNSYRSYFDFGKSSQQRAWFGAEGGEMNYYFFYGPSIKKVLSRYAELTGYMPLPPLWALGNQQSRWSYYPETMVDEVVKQYRTRDLPLDVVHLDIDYMQGYRVFTFDPERFPDPKAFASRLREQGVKLVTIVDPGIKYQPSKENTAGPNEPAARQALTKQDKSYYVFNEGLAKGFFQKRRNGQLFIPKVWPGESVFVDYTLPEARRWWGDLHRSYIGLGIAGIWNDMNEPSDFNDQTGKNQIDVISHDEGEMSSHAKNRNLFALLMSRATYEGLERLQPDKRPYVITRAGYAGIQRYATMWTGDTMSSWESLALSIPMFQTLGLSGQPFVGSDVGGFIGRGNGELLVRSYQVSFLVPFCRNHKVIDGYDQEPWRFGDYYEDIIRRYLKLRYELMPFLYTKLEEAHRTGAPPVRPLLLNFQNDANTYNLDDQFMIGDELLVAPILKAGQTHRLVYLPQGKWFDYWTGQTYSGNRMIRVEAPLETVPMFVRGGSAVPKAPPMNYVNEKPRDPITFEIYPDDNGRAAGTLYEDDGESPAYKKGSFRRTAVRVSPIRGGHRVVVEAPTNGYAPAPRKFVFAIRSGKIRKTASVPDNGKLQTVEVR